MTISNTNAGGTGDASGTNVGQTFTNDPGGNGDPVYLNNWTFAFNGNSNATIAKNLTLSIYQGVGTGGTLIYTSNASTITTFGAISNGAVQWDFAGGAQLFDDALYTAVVTGSAPTSPQFLFGSGYGSGNFGAGTDYTSSAAFDLVFQGNFSTTPTPVTPVPFEFETTSGLAILGGAWLLRKYVQKKAAKNKV